MREQTYGPNGGLEGLHINEARRVVDEMVRRVDRPRLLDPGMSLTLRPMRYPQYYEMYRNAIKNTWTVEEVDFSTDVKDLREKLSDSERHLIHRLVAFFATGDSIVANNLVLNLYKHINAPEARMYLSRQLYEEAQHVQFYLTLLDTYITSPEARVEAFQAIETIPSIKAKGDFCLHHLETAARLETLDSRESRREFLYNLATFACAVEGLFFFAAFAYVYYLRSRGLCQGLASGTNWVFRDECVVAGTEVLTPEGWVKIEDLKEGVGVAQFDMQTSEVSFAVPSKYTVNDIDEDVVVYANQKGGIHQALTKGHDVVQRWDYQKTWSKQKAGEFKPSTNKVLPVSGYKNTGRTSLTPVERFLIALQADGSLPSERYTGARSGTLPVIFQLKKERKILRLREVLSACGFEWTEAPTNGGRTQFRVSVPLHSAVLTKSFKDWVKYEDVSHTWAAQFIDEVSHWDGHTPKDTANGYGVYYSSIVEDNVEVVQTLAALCGRHASRFQQTKLRPDGTPYTPQYRTIVHKSDYVRGGRGLNRKEVPYRGKVYCVTIPTGAILIRSQGKVSVTGNCGHMQFAFDVFKTCAAEEPDLVDASFESRVRLMLVEAIACEMQFAEDLLSGGVLGLSLEDMRTYLEHVADQRLMALGMTPVYGVKNPFPFMELQDTQELSNFFERRPTAYQVGVEGEVVFDKAF